VKTGKKLKPFLVFEIKTVNTYCLYNIEHIPTEETALAQHAFMQTLCAALQATDVAGVAGPKASVPIR